MKNREASIKKFLDNKMTLEELEILKKEYLLEIFSYVKKNSKFYKQKFNNLCLGEKEVFNTLAQLPFTTKDDLRNAALDICCKKLDEIEVYYETTGTTGPTTPCPRSKCDVLYSGLYVENAMEKIYQERFGSMQALTAIMGPSELYAFGDTYGNICKKLSIPYVKLWPESPRVGIPKAAELINKLNIKVLICSPAIALGLARYFIINGISPDNVGIRQILLLGELCTRSMLKNISKIWACNCAHGLYGSQEIHALATGDSDGNLNISETNYIIETLPLKNFSDKNIGELCVTMLVPGAKPLIRFRTGDVIRKSSFGKIEILGRKDDIIDINNTKYLPADIEQAILNIIPMVYGYEVEIHSKNDKDIVGINVISNDKTLNKNIIENKLSSYFKTDVFSNLVTELNEKTEKGAYVSWKYARIKDYRENEE